MISLGNDIAKVGSFQRISLRVNHSQDIKMEPEAELNPPGKQKYQLFPRPYCLICQNIFMSRGFLQEHFRTKHPGLPVGPELLEEEDENDDEDSDEVGKEGDEEEGDDMEEADEEEDVKPDVNDEYCYPSEIFQENPYENTRLFKKTNDWVTKNLLESDLWPHYKLDDAACTDLVAEYKIKRREAAKKSLESDDEEPSTSKTTKRKAKKKAAAPPNKRKRSKAAEAPKAKKKTENSTEVTPELLELGESVRVSLFRGDFHSCNICHKTFYSSDSYFNHHHDVTPAEAERLEKENPWNILLDRCDDLVLAYTRTRGTALNCDVCDHIAKNVVQLRRHKRFCRPECVPSEPSPTSSSQTVSCDHCGLIVKNALGLRRHQASCRILKEKSLGSGSKLSSSRSGSSVKCDACGADMKNMKGLQVHKRFCSGRSS